MPEPDDHIARLREELASATSRTRKLNARLALSTALRAANASESLEHAKEALKLSEAPGYESEVGHCRHQVGLSLLSIGEYTAASQHLREAFREFEEREELDCSAAVALALGEIELRRRRYRKALEWFEEALARYRRSGDRSGESSTMRALGNLHAGIGDDLHALEYLHAALSIVEGSDDRNAIGVLLSDIATVHGAVGDHDKALEFFTRSRECFDRTGNHFFSLRALANLARTHLLCDRRDQALECAERARASYAILSQGEISSAVRESMAAVLEVIGHVYESNGELLAALEHYRRGLATLADVENEEAQARSLLAIGKLCLQLDDQTGALLAFQEGLFVAQQSGDRRLQYQLHERLATTMKRLGDAVGALHHYEQFATIREQVLGFDKQQAIAELQARFDLERAQKEMEIIRLQNEKLEQEVAVKTRELTAMALHLVEKNQFLDSLKKEMSDVAQSIEGPARPAVKSLLRQVDGNISSEKDWKAFEQQFELVHHDFLKRLAHSCPSLSRTELKVCALLKINLSTKEIADLLASSDRTIGNHRYHIRKKLGLSDKIDLNTYLAGM